MSGLRISKIRLNGGTQTRDTRCEATVREFAEDMSNGATFPPVVVFYDGECHWLADGFHRVDAASIAGKKDIEADVRQGTRRDAILFSVGANSAHGLRRTNADKRRAVLVLLNDEEWSNNSDRWIAEKCGVSHTLVQKIRSEVATVATSKSTENQEPKKRTGQDGKSYSEPRKTRAKEPEPEEPETEDTSEEAPKPAPKRTKEPEEREPEAEDDDDVAEESDFVKASRLVFEVDDYLRNVAESFPPHMLSDLHTMVNSWSIRLERKCNERLTGNG